MKYILQILSLLLFFELSLSSYQTKKSNYSGFGAINFKISPFSDIDNAVFMGGKGAVIFPNNFYLGGAGYFLLNEVRPIPQHSELKSHFGYGGLLVGYLYQAKKNIAITSDILIGAGHTFLYQTKRDSETLYYNSSISFMSEFSYSLLFTLSHSLKIETGVSYRYVNENEYYSSSQLSGYGFNLNFLFGKF